MALLSCAQKTIILVVCTGDLSMFFLPSSLLWLAWSLKSFPVRCKLSKKRAHEILKLSLLRSVIGNRYYCIKFFHYLKDEKKRAEDERKE